MRRICAEAVLCADAVLGQPGLPGTARQAKRPATGGNWKLPRFPGPPGDQSLSPHLPSAHAGSSCPQHPGHSHATSVKGNFSLYHKNLPFSPVPSFSATSLEACHQSPISPKLAPRNSSLLPISHQLCFGPVTALVCFPHPLPLSSFLLSYFCPLSSLQNIENGPATSESEGTGQEFGGRWVFLSGLAGKARTSASARSLLSFPRFAVTVQLQCGLWNICRGRPATDVLINH